MNAREQLLASYGIDDDPGLIEAMAETERNLANECWEIANEYEQNDDLELAEIARSHRQGHDANARELEALL